MAERYLHFSDDEMDRLRAVCMDLGTSRIEFLHFAVMQAIGEMEGYMRDSAAVRAYYESRNGARYDILKPSLERINGETAKRGY